MSVSGTPRKPPPPHPVVIAFLIVILAGVIYLAFTLNQIKNSNTQRLNTAAQQAR